jgi:hypothetical protein
MEFFCFFRNGLQLIWYLKQWQVLLAENKLCLQLMRKMELCNIFGIAYKLSSIISRFYFSIFPREHLPYGTILIESSSCSKTPKTKTTQRPNSNGVVLNQDCPMVLAYFEGLPWLLRLSLTSFGRLIFAKWLKKSNK